MQFFVGPPNQESKTKMLQRYQWLLKYSKVPESDCSQMRDNLKKMHLGLVHMTKNTEFFKEQAIFQKKKHFVVNKKNLLFSYKSVFFRKKCELRCVIVRANVCNLQYILVATDKVD